MGRVACEVAIISRAQGEYRPTTSEAAQAGQMAASDYVPIFF
jgi:hypothetical protein